MIIIVLLKKAKFKEAYALEEFVKKMKEYLAMDTEIDFQEFEHYYRQLVDYLNADYQSLAAEDLLKLRYILSVVSANAAGRGARKDKNVKKYRKIEEKTNFWHDAITYKLKKECAYTEDSLREAEGRIEEEMQN